MKEMSHQNRPSAVRALYLALRHRLPLEGETAMFIMASTLDAILTRYFILLYGGQNGHTFVESNRFRGTFWRAGDPTGWCISSLPWSPR